MKTLSRLFLAAGALALVASAHVAQADTIQPGHGPPTVVGHELMGITPAAITGALVNNVVNGNLDVNIPVVAIVEHYTGFDLAAPGHASPIIVAFGDTRAAGVDSNTSNQKETRGFAANFA